VQTGLSRQAAACYDPAVGREIQRAGFWRRGLATLLDVLFLLILILLVEAVVSSINMRPTGDPNAVVEINIVIGGALIFVVAILYTFSEGVVGASLGKLCTGLKIANPDGTAASKWTLHLRWMTKWSFLLLGLLAVLVGQALIRPLANLMQLIVFIGCFPAADGSKLAWHDQWAHTAVFRRRLLFPGGEISRAS
jgi:uncharacterized RDD family membrane protein YckC